MSHYIVQSLSKFLSFEHFQKTYKEDDSWIRYLDKSITEPSFDDLYQNKLLMVVGEPGFGKTRLLKEIVLQARSKNKKAFFVDAKKISTSIENTLLTCKVLEDGISEEVLQKKVLFKSEERIELVQETIVCLDALDELPFPRLYTFFEQIEAFLEQYPHVQLFVSCRTHHLQKVDYDLSAINFEYIELSEFSARQILVYLSKYLTSVQINEINEKTKLTGLFNLITTPRYLYYFTELVKDKEIDEIIGLSRADLFENFIYRKLDKERNKETPHAQYDIIKRVLEKIAFVMKLYQVSQINKDELLTLFDSLESNFSQIIFRDDLLNIFYDRSIIKDNLDFIEFENQQFLDYLAAKELCRFDQVEQVFFDIAVEPNIEEIYPAWFYVMPFVLEQQPKFLDLLLDFMEKKSAKSLGDDYFHTLTSVEAKNLSSDRKDRIFSLIFDYCNTHNRWLFRVRELVYFYEEALHYDKIVDSVDESKYSKDQLYIRRGNTVDLIEVLALHDKLSGQQLDFWKQTFFTWLNFDAVDKYLHRNIIHALGVVAKGDLDYIKSIEFIFENGIETQHEYAQTCFKVAPEDPFCIDIYFKADKQYNKNKKSRSGTIDHSGEYIIGVKTRQAITYVLQKFLETEGKRHLFSVLDDLRVERYEEPLKSFVENISNVLDHTIIQQLKQFVSILLEDVRTNDLGSSKYLLKSLIELLLKEDNSYFKELIDHLFTCKRSSWFHFSIEEEIVEYFGSHLSIENFKYLYAKYEVFDTQRQYIDHVMFLFYEDERTAQSIKDYIYEKHQTYIEEIYINRNQYQEKLKRDTINKQEGLCRQWKHKIEPEPEHYRRDLFRFFKNKKEQLQVCPDYKQDRKKTIDVAKKIIENYNPLTGKVEQKGSSATKHEYKECIEFLHDESVPISEQNIKDNIFRYLPFNINSDYESTLALAGIPSPVALQDVVDVYAGKRDDDLGTYHPQNFLEFYKRTSLKTAEPLLLEMLTHEKIDDYVKKQIIDALPQNVLTKEWIKNYIHEHGENDPLFEKLLIILFKKHHDQKAIDRAFKILMETANNTDTSELDSLFDSGLRAEDQPLALALSHIDYPIKRDQELLLLADVLHAQGKKINADFLNKHVSLHVSHLMTLYGYVPILEMEKFLQKNSDKINLKWFEYELLSIKEKYLKDMARPSNIAESIKTYNDLKAKEYLTVRSASHLWMIVQECIDHDIRNWIENEGAYKFVEELSKKEKNTNAEDFIQKTIKSQIELALLKRGLRKTEIRREEQLLDDKRVDFIISYGFTGSVLIELKLAHNDEAKAAKPGKAYVKKLKSYIAGTHADYGIFLIFNLRDAREKFEQQIQDVSKLYEEERDIVVHGINCKI